FRLAKNLLEKQDYPDARLQTYDDSGWTLGYAFNVEDKEIRDKAVLDITAPLLKSADLKGKVNATATAGLAVAHFHSNNIISVRYKRKNVRMKSAEKSFTAGTTDFPAG